jgi:hypothetical protein
MKSIREWMFEKGFINEEFDKKSMEKYFGSSTIEVDHKIKRELKPKIIRIIDMNSSVPRDELLGRIKAAVSHIVSGSGGRTFASRSMAKKLGGEDESDVDATKFSRMMGSEKMEVDYDIRRELKPKIIRIMDMYSSVPKPELQDKIIAAVTQLISDSSGSRLSLSLAKKKIDDFSEDPIAKESVLPSFLHWIENSEEQGDSVSEPQHEEGEENMDLKSTVEKRIMKMAMEIESDGKGTRQEVLAAIKSVVDTASQEKDQGLGDQQGTNPPPMTGQQASVNPQETPALQPGQP